MEKLEGQRIVAYVLFGEYMISLLTFFFILYRSRTIMQVKHSDVKLKILDEPTPRWTLSLKVMSLNFFTRSGKGRR